MVCHDCGTELKETIIDFSAGGILLKDVKAHVCPGCGEVVFDSAEAKEVERRLTGCGKQ